MKNSIYDEMPETYSDLRKGWMFWTKIDWIVELIRRTWATSFVDYGCGTGDFVAELARIMPEVRFAWYDINETYVEHAKKTYGANKNLVFVSSLDTDDTRQSDIVYVNDVIHHFPHETDFLSHLATFPHDRLIVLEPNQFNPYVAYAQATMPGERNFSQKSFQEALPKILPGAKVLERGYKFAFPNSFSTLSPILERADSLLGRTKFFGWAVYYVIENGTKWKSS